MSEHAKAGRRDLSRSILGKKLLNYICQEVYKRKPKIVEGDLYKFLDIVDDQEIMIMGHGINNKIVCLFPCPPLYHLITVKDIKGQRRYASIDIIDIVNRGVIINRSRIVESYNPE